MTAKEPHRPRLVAGAIGPTNRTLSISPSVEDPGFRNCTWDEVVTAYKEQVHGLCDGGCHILMVETIFDTLNAKAALFAIDEFFDENPNYPKLPLIISGTIVDQSGRTLSGKTTEAFYISMQHSNPLVIGLNCALGASQMVPFMQALSDAAECFVHSYPNAGLPNAMGGYDEEPESFAESLKQFCELGLVNMLGGCCGIQPAHIDALDKMLLKMKYKPRVPTKKPQHMWLSGLEAIDVEAANSYLNIGERCNIAGSIKFKKLILNSDYDKGLEIAKAQAEGGAQVIDAIAFGTCGKSGSATFRERLKQLSFFGFFVSGDRRQHGRGAARRRVRDEEVPQHAHPRARHLAPPHLRRFVQIPRRRGGPQVLPG